jgi:protease-4
MARQVFTPDEAVEEGVVDEAAFDDEAVHALGAQARVVRPGEMPARARLRWRFAPMRRPLVAAVIPVRGQILTRGSGLKHARAALATRIIPQIESARRSPAVSAIVLDIDSRGGSAIASDAIYRAAHTAAGLKPVVAFIGDVAASGGYYIASAAHEILASPDAVTGSIGVFGGKVASDGIMEKAGVRLERLTLGDPGAGLMLPDRPFTEEERLIVRKEMQSVYETFLRVVAERRGKEAGDLEEVAGGRVFSARRALEADLVDAIGTREELVGALAARMKCRRDRVAMRFMGGGGLLEEFAVEPVMGAAVERAVATIDLVARERIAAELPFDLIMGSP